MRLQKKVCICVQTVPCAKVMSTLCHGVNGEPLTHVVDIMHEMTWLYAHTRYSHCVESIKDEYRDNGEWYNINNVVNEAKVLATRSWFAEVGQHKTWKELETTLPDPSRVSRLTKPTQL